MIGTLIQNSWKQLRRDRGAQVLAFVVPIAFFSIFAVIFGPRGSSVTGTSRVSVAVADESDTPKSRALVAALAADSGLRVMSVWTGRATGADANAAGEPVTRALAERLVKAGQVSAGLVLPAGIDSSIMSFGRGHIRALVLHDPSEPVAAQMVSGLLQRAALKAGGAGPFGLTGADPDAMLPIRVEQRAVLGERRESPMIAFYAAGIAVMFIMFSAASAGGVLIEETESGTLERVLTSGLGMNGLLAAKWIYLTSLACM